MGCTTVPDRREAGGHGPQASGSRWRPARCTAALAVMGRERPRVQRGGGTGDTVKEVSRRRRRGQEAGADYRWASPYLPLNHGGLRAEGHHHRQCRRGAGGVGCLAGVAARGRVLQGTNDVPGGVGPWNGAPVLAPLQLGGRYPRRGGADGDRAAGGRGEQSWRTMGLWAHAVNRQRTSRLSLSKHDSGLGRGEEERVVGL